MNNNNFKIDDYVKIKDGKFYDAYRGKVGLVVMVDSEYTTILLRKRKTVTLLSCKHNNLLKLDTEYVAIRDIDSLNIARSVFNKIRSDI